MPVGTFLPSDPEALTTTDAAELVSVSPKTVRAKIRSGDLPAVEFRGQYWVLRSDVVELFAPRPVQRRDDAGAQPHLSPEETEARWNRLSTLLGGGAR